MADVFAKPRPKTLFFDLMGTCLDWHTSLVPTLTTAFETASSTAGVSPPNQEHISAFALRWRQGFFDETALRLERGQPVEDIDTTHLKVLDQLLKEEESILGWTESLKEYSVQQWHKQIAWPDVASALPKLRKHFDVVVLANGTPRLQVDLTKHSGLSFDVLFSSELIGFAKPDPQAYLRAMTLLKREPEDCVMIAAHAYDLRGAKGVGLRTVYLQRWSEDPAEDMTSVKREVDYFINGLEHEEGEGPMEQVARLFGCD